MMTGKFEKYVILCYLGIGIATAGTLELLSFPSKVLILPYDALVWAQAILIACFGTLQQFILVCELLHNTNCDTKY